MNRERLKNETFAQYKANLKREGEASKNRLG